jgi:dienelactone hydrolase
LFFQHGIFERVIPKDFVKRMSRSIRTLFRFLTVTFLTAVFSFAQGSIADDLRKPDPAAPSSGSIEDYSTPSLAKSDLRVDPPEPGDKDDEKDFVREFVKVQWRPGDRIYLYVVRPKNVPKPPVVIYLYGHPSEVDRYQDNGWCTRATAGGYAAVGFVPALTGHRYHDRPMKEWFVSELQESLGKSAHDVQMVLNYLAERGDVDINNVGIFGAGAGGTIAVAAASVDPRIKALYLLDPWGDWPKWTAKSDVIPDQERPRYLKTEFLKKVAPFDPVALLPKFKTPHLRLDQLNDDFTTVPEVAKKRIEAALPARAEHHRFTNGNEFYAASSGGRIFDWIKTQVQVPQSTDRGAASREPSAESKQADAPQKQ